MHVVSRLRFVVKWLEDEDVLYNVLLHVRVSICSTEKHMAHFPFNVDGFGVQANGPESCRARFEGVQKQ